MEIEELNKSQIVLLTLLVSFVTSLATGIVTVSLMEQGVTPVTNTVNQIVERTKEVVVKVPEPQDPIVITETKEVVVPQSELIAAAVSKNKNSTIILYQVVNNEVLTEEATGQNTDFTEENVVSVTDTESIENMEVVETTDQVATALTAVEDEEMETIVFASRAIVLPNEILATDAYAISEGNEYVILDSNGERVPVLLQNITDDIALFSASIGTPTTLADTTQLKRGQTVIALSGTDRLKVTTGIISDIVIENDNIKAVELDAAVATPGSALINIDGELIGMSTYKSRTLGDTWFTPSNDIETALENNIANTAL